MLSNLDVGKVQQILWRSLYRANTHLELCFHTLHAENYVLPRS